MKKKLGLLTLLTSLPLYAGTMGSQASENSWYASVGAGYSWTLLPGINNSNPAEWDASAQGYDSSLGDRGFFTLELGKQVHRYIDVSLLYLNHETFNYQMYQSGTSATEGFTGAQRNRYFNLSNRALLVSGFLHPDHPYYELASIGVKPFIGAGIGYARNQVTNFYTVGTIAVAGTALGSTSSIGNQVNTNSFSWQGSLGLNLTPKASHASVDIGYRYFDGGNFNTSNIVYADVGGLIASTPWSGRVKANQLFVDFRYTV